MIDGWGNFGADAKLALRVGGVDAKSKPGNHQVCENGPLRVYSGAATNAGYDKLVLAWMEKKT